MKALFWIGLTVLLLGVASLFVAIPQEEEAGIKVGDAEMSVQTTHDRKVPPLVSAVTIIGGIGMMIGGATALRKPA